MSGDGDRGTGSTKAGQRERGVDAPPVRPTHCRAHKLIVPPDYNALEAAVEKWISKCVLSRTERDGQPIRRERQLVRGNASLLEAWQQLASQTGQPATLNVKYVWSGGRTEALHFSVMALEPSKPRALAKTVAPKISDPATTANDRTTDEEREVRWPLAKQKRWFKAEDEDETKDDGESKRHDEVDGDEGGGSEEDPWRILDRAKKLLDRLRRSDGGSELGDRLRETIGGIAATMAGIGPLKGYVVWSRAKKRLMLVRSDHYSILRVWSRAEREGRIEELERRYSTLDNILREGDSFDFEEHEPLPPDSPLVKVRPTVRGNAVEHFRLQNLTGRGYEGLPNSYPGIDAVKGNYAVTVENGIYWRTYNKPDAISIKSTMVVDPQTLWNNFSGEYMRPFKTRYAEARQGVRIRGLGKKELHLVFEEGALSALEPRKLKRVAATLERMNTAAKKAKVVFQWFAFVGGTEVSGPTHLKNLQLDGP